jgi:ketosteroid isomerase-like protein
MFRTNAARCSGTVQAMSDLNRELVVDWLAAQARSDTDAVRAALAEDVVWHVPGKNLLSRDYNGPNEVLGFLAHVRELSRGTARPQIIDVLSSQDYVIVLVRVFAERDGRTLDGSFQAWAYRIEGGEIADFWFLVEDRYQVDAFWS